MDTIGSGLGILIMMNNYFHDVATGLLMSSGFAIWLIMKRYDEAGGPQVDDYFLRLYKSMTGLAKFSLYWILIGGVPRTIFYKRFEWNTAVEHGQVMAIIVKHILVILFVGTGVYVWHNVNRRAREIRARQEGAASSASDPA